MLTFEIDSEGEKIDVHADEAGLVELHGYLDDLIRIVSDGGQEHLHLMTPEWGGDALSGEALAMDTTLVNHVKLHGWPKGE